MHGRALGCIAVFALLASGCGGDANGHPTGRSHAPLVHGADDRHDLWKEPESTVRGLVVNTAVALVEPRNLRFSGDSVEPRAAPLGSWDDYCGDTPFLEQPTAASCSGVLIDEDLVLTAGHCMEGVPSCRDYAYVLDYAFNTEGRLGLSHRSSVFACRAVVAFGVSPPDSEEQLDFAVIALDRKTGRLPAGIVRSPDLVAGNPLTVIGFPSGLPAKIDDGAVVVDPRAEPLDHFSVTSDTFRGSSGSAVYLGTFGLAGVFSRGTSDFVDDGRCRRARTLPDDVETSGELATYATRALDAICDSGWPSSALCGIVPACGDGFCTGGENASTCPADCNASECGDRLCESSEWESCSVDCGDRRPAGLPDEWYCEPSWYDDGEVCDCRCGAVDADCDPSKTSTCDAFGPNARPTQRFPPIEASGGCGVAKTSPLDDWRWVAAMFFAPVAHLRRRALRTRS
jgi:hypothetical protein